MTENKSISNTKDIVESAIQGMQEKIGKQIVNMDLSKIDNAVCQNFVICHGDSNRQVSAIAESVQEFIKKKTNENPWHKEGVQNAEWILLDYSNIVVHIFNEQARKFYNLEGLWADAEITLIED
jgi:ribosome-associated protein